MKRVAPILGLLVLVVLANPVAASSSLGGSDHWHPYPSGIIPGDIVIGHNPLSDLIIPGYWTHTGIIAYYDSNAGDWVVIEAWDNPSAVRMVYLSDFLKRYDTVAVLRVRTTNEIRLAAVNFAFQQLGKPYDWKWWTKEVYGDSYYCSELVWASYKAVGGPDIDAHPGFSWKYLWGVAPQEIYDDGDTYVIYYHSDA
ncbi:YiiX/YebB-like N1pC/P60 family cysteine hydrolase [Thermococcus sp.]|uniref:YiiX/YebB-like N1pC/P60 family cysteine hydrolase n=1 Tax=Thermococcus sp. TaxID=35749 RepID=UPI00262C0BAE|nr:YiiX/YebB-like N1pC/P60 family cysteine hydrolase [Thermococcus sp.]